MKSFFAASLGVLIAIVVYIIHIAYDFSVFLLIGIKSAWFGIIILRA
jgi:hypothetical protein